MQRRFNFNAIVLVSQTSHFGISSVRNRFLLFCQSGEREFGLNGEGGDEVSPCGREVDDDIS